jgi:hypothetical protein
MSRSLGITVNAPASQLKGRAAIIVIAVALSLAFAWRCHAGEEASEGGARIVAIGDVHGDLEDFRRILEATGLADSFGNWTGGSATLVQTGDLVERGTKVREVLDLTMSLQQQAPLAGGEVVVLLGNHEVNNLLGYLDYQSTPSGIYSEIFASFADSSSVDRQKRARVLRSHQPHRPIRSLAPLVASYGPPRIDPFRSRRAESVADESRTRLCVHGQPGDHQGDRGVRSNP